jgi:alpha-tubulin suppressor-like RCC1 family protein
LGHVDSGCFAICSGWSHILALTRDEKDHSVVALHGWGRNDKGQLGIGSMQDHVLVPRTLEPRLDSEGAPISDGSIQAACCGAESSHVLDVNGNVYSTGWNEHGNLAVGHMGNDVGDYSVTWMATSGASVVAPPPTKATGKLIAAGGAHLIVIAV